MDALHALTVSLPGHSIQRKRGLVDDYQARVSSTFRLAIPLHPQDKPQDFPPSFQHHLREEYAVRYLEKLGVTPTPETMRLVESHVPIEKCAVTAAWKSRGWLADFVYIAPYGNGGAERKGAAPSAAGGTVQQQQHQQAQQEPSQQQQQQQQQSLPPAGKERAGGAAAGTCLAAGSHNWRLTILHCSHSVGAGWRRRHERAASRARAV